MRLYLRFNCQILISYVAAKLGIADLLKDTPLHYEQSATATQTHAPSLYRLLRALASLEIFVETEVGYFALGKLGIYLQSNRADSLRAFVMMQGEEHYQAWGQLLYSIRTGESAFEYLYLLASFWISKCLFFALADGNALHWSIDRCLNELGLLPELFQLNPISV